MTALLGLRDVVKSFGATTVLKEVSFDVGVGEVISLVGENGSGKSTTARIIAGVQRPDSGGILIDGVFTRMVGPAQARAAGICYVGQEPALVPAISVRDNLSLPGLRWWGSSRPSDRVQRALDQVGLDCDPRQWVQTLSAAEQAKLEIAKALLVRPRLLVLDEVTTRMPDPSSLLDLVRDLSRQGVGSILITHRFSEIKSVADRAIVLRDGRIVGELAGAETTDARLGAMMVGREIARLERVPSARRDAVALRVEDLRPSPTAPTIDLTVHEGEIVGVGGLMGSGRSRLLEAVAGARRPGHGRVEVGGAPVGTGSVASARAAGIRLVPEDRDRQGLVRRHTIRANIALSTHRLFRLPRTRVELRVADAMRRQLGIKAPSSEARVDTLSGGNAQKVVFAREVDGDPRVYLLDEPTRGVDVGARVDIYDVIRARVGAGAAVLVASSDLQELVVLCDRVVVLFEGQIVGELEGEQITEEDIVVLASGATRETQR